MAVSVNRIAWNNGVVVATCPGCNVKHLLADNGGLLDLLNDTNFKNVVQFIEAKGDIVQRLDRTDDDALKRMGLRLGKDGKLRLLDDSDVGSGHKGNTTKSDAAEGAPAEDAPVEDAMVEAPAESVPLEGLGAIAAGAPPPGGAEEDVEVDPIIVRLPPGARPNDVLKVSSEFGELFAQVPKGATEGCRIEVQGMVEIGLGDSPRWIQASGKGEWEQTVDWEVGDVVAVPMPEGAVARIPIPESAAVDATLKLGYPIVVMPEK